MDLAVLEILRYWIRERDSIRMAKESNQPKPWTKDPIFQQYKFCNVHREDDFVTRWFKANWRHEKNWEKVHFIPAIMLGRTINWPVTLAALGFPEGDYKLVLLDYLVKMNAMMANKEKVYTGAYMITAGPTGVKKNDWVLGNAEHYFRSPPRIDPRSLQKSWETIINNKYPCVGPFIAGQVIADLKHTVHLNDADDWWDWAPLGPGSARGLNRVYGRKVGNAITQEQAVKEMLAIRKELNLNPYLCLQDIQNCLCELDKYMRVKLGQGKPRSSYPGLQF